MEVSGNEFQIRRWVRRLESGLVRLDQEIRVQGTHTGVDVSGSFWIFAMVDVREGSIVYCRDRQRIAVPADHFAMFLPPYSLVQVALHDSHSYSMGLVSRERLPEDFPTTPVVFASPTRQCPSSLEELSELVGESRDFLDVGRAQDVSPLARRIKAVLDETFCESRPISQLALRLRTSPAVVSRYFKRAYGMPPVHYRHHLRVTEAMIRLVEGRAVSDVSQEVGFEDLSAFYRQFRKHMIGPPTEYKP